MNQFIALFRGINVGGKHLLPMAELKSIMEANGCMGVRTYIQSGNAVFSWNGDDVIALVSTIRAGIEAAKGFRPNIHILSASDFDDITAQNPYGDIDADPKTVHVNFLLEPAIDANTDAIEGLRAPTEQYELTDSAFFLHAPDGIGRSKLVAKLEQHLGVEITGRNLRTINKLAVMLKEAK